MPRREPTPVMIFVCIARGHEWRLFARYNWHRRERVLLCERCPVCGARRGLGVARDYSLIR